MAVLNDKKLAKGLVEKGQKRQGEYSWLKLAEETKNLYQNS
jgi:hypothetical protein